MTARHLDVAQPTCVCENGIEAPVLTGCNGAIEILVRQTAELSCRCPRCVRGEVERLDPSAQDEYAGSSQFHGV